MLKTRLSIILVSRSLILGASLIFLLSGSAPSQDRPTHLPDPKHTPGDTLYVTRDDLCGGRNKTLESRIPVRVKSQVFDLYGVPIDGSVAFNVDHLVPVSLGGSNTIRNLWPQPLAGEWGYGQKNRLERQLQKLVCSGRLELKAAQEEITRDWVGAYKKYVLEPKQTKSGRD